MRRTPAQRALMAKMAAQIAARSPPGGAPQGSAYELMLVQLAEHRRTLKTLQSIERKIEAKRSFLDAYDPWVDGVLATGQGAQDVVLTTVLVWHIDAGHHRRALQIAAYAVQHALSPPDQYERSLGTILIDEFATAALAGKMETAEARELLPQLLTLTANLDAPDQARAKLHKAIGFALIGKVGPADVDLDQVNPADGQAALEHLQRALALHEQVGVKKDIERLERRLKAAPPPP